MTGKIVVTPARRVLLPFAVVVSLGSSLALAEQPPAVDQKQLRALSIVDPAQAFLDAFEAGDEITEAMYSRDRGVGANVGQGQLFTRIPRVDLDGAGEWAQHEPSREGGPNAQSCLSCHNVPYANGAGTISDNVLVDPTRSGDPSKYLERNTLPLFALGAVQRLAEEMTTELHAQRDAAADAACARGAVVEQALTAKSVSFGSIKAQPQAGEVCTASIIVSELEGIDEDLIVRPFGWKGTHKTIRAFSRDAAHNELGMQAVDLVGDQDGDHDGVTNELTVGDMTAMTIYMAALERPTTKIELADYGVIELSEDERTQIVQGESLFGEVGCASCHMPEMTLENAIFQEPSAHPAYRDQVFASGSDPETYGLSHDQPIAFSLAGDQPNNIVETHAGDMHLGAFASDGGAGATIQWFTDFKRHDMGEKLADPVDAFGFGASVWPTRSLAGVGSTGPWLHNGHATTLEDAILAHGGEANSSRGKFEDLDVAEQGALVAFLDNLIFFSIGDDEDEAH